MKIAGRNLSHHGTSDFVKNKLLWKVEVMMKTKQTDELLAKMSNMFGTECVPLVQIVQW